MFGKLLKYEFRYMMRIFLPMWGLFLVLSVINGFTVPQMASSDGASIVGFLFMLALVLVASALWVVSFVVIIQRFYNGLLKDEGYLMFCLPVKSGALINAKGLAAVILMCITIVVGLLGIFVILSLSVWSDVSLSEVGRAIEQMFINLTGYGVGPFQLTMMVIWFILMMLSSVASFMYMIYLAMALGHLAKKHRVAWSIGAYLLINMLMSTVSTLVFQFADWPAIGELVMESMSGMSASQALVTMEVGYTVVNLVLTLLFFFITRWILETRLNLE